MFKKAFYIGLLVIIVSCLIPLAGSKQARAQKGSYSAGNIDCVYSVETDFPLKLQFELSAKSSSDITDIRLHYTVDHDSFADVTGEVFVEFSRGKSVDTTWTWDMRKTGGLPPGTGLEYWWTVTGAGGDKVETPRTQVRFEDTRYAWKSLSEGKITIYWYKGDNQFAAELMSTAQEALARLEEGTGAVLKNPVSIFIYAGSQDLQGAMVYPQEWTGGAAYTLYHIVVLGITPDELAWGESALAHELTHLVVGQIVFNPYIDLPTWLDEGLAMYNQGPLDVSFASSLAAALENNNLITVRSLASPFSADPATAYLSYAQSYSLVEYLISTYGQQKMLQLLTDFSRGSDYDDALAGVYGFDMDGLDAVWRNHVYTQYGKPLPKITLDLAPTLANLAWR
jgi:hypothetical protein